MTFKKADTQDEAVQSLGCTHPGCRMLWTIDIGRKLCSLHQWGSSPEPKPEERQTRFFTKEEKLAVIKKISNIGKMSERSWAYALKERDAAGDRLTSHQRKAYKEVIG